MHWEVKTVDNNEQVNMLSLLSMLADNTIAAIRIPHFFSPEELEPTIKKINKHTISWYPNSEGKQGRIGLSATEYYPKQNGKALYFEQVPKHKEIRDSFFSHTTNPIEKIITLFSKSSSISIATEPSMNNAEYFSGLIRVMGAKSTLHFDHAPHQLSGWHIAGSKEQFGLVTYLQMPVSGGELLVYNRPWTLKDDAFNKDKIQKGPYGFNPVFLNGETPKKIAPQKGDLLIFRTRNFHQIDEVDPGQGQYRITINSFLSRNKDSFFLWN